MILSRRFLLALGISGWAILAAVNAAGKNARRQEKSRHGTQLNTWEGEGGNVLPHASTVEPEPLTLPRRN
ncbi:MAG: hypothetical protein JWQ21_1656 [Herminiimonas sp.]|nr:hypothetical protein [Herminiimonas sp.]